MRGRQSPSGEKTRPPPQFSFKARALAPAGPCSVHAEALRNGGPGGSKVGDSCNENVLGQGLPSLPYILRPLSGRLNHGGCQRGDDTVQRAVLPEGSALGRLIRDFDWSKTYAVQTERDRATGGREHPTPYL